MHIVHYKETENIEDIITNESATKIMLTEYFRMNYIDAYARNFLYKEYPEYYRWDSSRKTWSCHRNRRKQIGRLVSSTCRRRALLLEDTAKSCEGGYIF